MPRFSPAASAALKQKMTALEAFHDDRSIKQVGSDVWDRSKAYGRAVAAAVWSYSTTDKVGHDHYLAPFQGYRWEANFKKDGDWKPTFPGPGKPMGGVCGNARTFAVKESDKICRKPLPYSTSNTSELYAQALEVYAQNTPTLSYEAEWIGEFWSDDLLDLYFQRRPAPARHRQPSAETRKKQPRNGHIHDRESRVCLE